MVPKSFVFSFRTLTYLIVTRHKASRENQRVIRCLSGLSYLKTFRKISFPIGGDTCVQEKTA